MFNEIGPYMHSYIKTIKGFSNDPIILIVPDHLSCLVENLENLTVSWGECRTCVVFFSFSTEMEGAGRYLTTPRQTDFGPGST